MQILALNVFMVVFFPRSMLWVALWSRHSTVILRSLLRHFKRKIKKKKNWLSVAWLGCLWCLSCLPDVTVFLWKQLDSVLEALCFVSCCQRLCKCLCFSPALVNILPSSYKLHSDWVPSAAVNFSEPLELVGNRILKYLRWYQVNI